MVAMKVAVVVVIMVVIPGGFTAFISETFWEAYWR
jgi:hypothetical protein